MKDGKRSIDANELKRQIIAFATGCATTVLPIEIIIERIDAEDTVPALQVAHGKWVCLEAEIGYYACSECDHRILRAKCNYCPNCGAKMDE